MRQAGPVLLRQMLLGLLNNHAAGTRPSKMP